MPNFPTTLTSVNAGIQSLPCMVISKRAISQYKDQDYIINYELNYIWIFPFASFVCVPLNFLNHVNFWIIDFIFCVFFFLFLFATFFLLEK